MLRASLHLAVLFAIATTTIAAPLKIHFISGSREYKSDPSLREFKTYLENNFDMTVTASWGHDGIKLLEGLDALKDADLMLVFARRMKLGEDQMKLIRAHWENGKAIIGLRTASHAFGNDDNAVFDLKVMGNNYKGHYGNETVKVFNQTRHPVLKGVGPFNSAKLYKAGPLANDTIVLQIGDIGKDKHPVTMVHEYKGGRVFYSSLGVPEDFKDENFRRMLVNAIYWTTKRQAPKSKTGSASDVALFDGKDLSKWKFKKHRSNKSQWTVGRASLNPKNLSEYIVNKSGDEMINAKGRGVDIYSEFEFGDCLLTLEVMVPKGSNSGIYMMGNYEVQVFDSFLRSKVGPGDMGGIYGAAPPRTNASLGPGEWQTYVIDFTTPKFRDGKKIANARFNKVTLNDKVIHENVEVKGVTGGNLGRGETAKGPLMFQGDHGPVAYRNIRVQLR